MLDLCVFGGGWEHDAAPECITPIKNVRQANSGSHLDENRRESDQISPGNPFSFSRSPVVPPPSRSMRADAICGTSPDDVKARAGSTTVGAGVGVDVISTQGAVYKIRTVAGRECWVDSTAVK